MKTNIDYAKSMETKKRKQEERKCKISQAIESGTPCLSITTPISYEDQETLIVIGSDGSATVDTTISSDINKCLDRNYTIKSITMYNDRPVGASFKIPRKKVTLRS